MALLNFRGFRPLFFNGGLKRRLALCYHDINHISDPNLHQVEPQIFKSQIGSLIDRGYIFLSADDFMSQKSSRNFDKMACITFDDGYRSVLEFAAPILREFGIPGTLFLNSRLLGGQIFWRDKIRILISNDLVSDFENYLSHVDIDLARLIDFQNFYRSSKGNSVNSKNLEKHLDSFFMERQLPLNDSKLYLTESQLEEVLGYQITLGNHTLNHYRLSSLNQEEKRDEILINKKNFESLGLAEVKTFAIPFGENGSFDQDDIRLLKDYGYESFFMTNQRQKNLNIPEIDIDPLGLTYANRFLPPNEDVFKKV